MENKKANTSEHSSHLDSYHSFLQSLVGEEVQVYKGGPECKMGKLLDVQSDYICVYAQNNNNNKNNNNGNQNQNQNENNQNQNQNNIVYYRTEHLQSISENTKNNSMPRFQGQDTLTIDFHTAENFSKLVQQLIRTYVQVNQGGPESKTGFLLDIAGNYMALLTEDDGVVYYNIHHIKSISELGQNTQNQENTNNQQLTIPDYFKADDFHQLFGQMSHKWVSINRGGPQALEGVLVQSAGGHYTLINNDEVLRINPFHIKSISCGPKGVLKQNNNNNQEQNKQSQNSNKQGNTEDESSSSNESSESTRSSSSHRSSGHGRSGRSSSVQSRRSRSSYPREQVVKTYDYIWNPRR